MTFHAKPTTESITKILLRIDGLCQQWLKYRFNTESHTAKTRVVSGAR